MKYYIVYKVGKDKVVNTTIRAVEVLESDNKRKRYLDVNGKEVYYNPFAEFIFNSESHAQSKIVEIIEEIHKEEIKKIQEKHKLELEDLVKNQEAEKTTILQSIKIQTDHDTFIKTKYMGML